MEILMITTPLVTPWEESEAPTQSALWRFMTGEGLLPYSWSNGPFDIYTAHTHSYEKVVYVVEGSITFGLPEFGYQVTLKAGDRLDLPAGTVHEARVGAQGVVCLEAHRG
jgi:mannose-6-phosphate isomerase-like protein (cupin superfamily)